LPKSNLAKATRGGGCLRRRQQKKNESNKLSLSDEIMTIRYIILVCITTQALSFTFNTLGFHPRSISRLHLTENENEMNPLVKSSWYAVEVFGKFFGKSDSKGEDLDPSKPPKSLKETLRRIELDNERLYFLSGQVDKLIYAENCVFSDPFVSFAGRDRFVDNLKNLGSFITKYDAKMIGYNINQNELSVDTKVMVKLELNLPWKPILAWPWGVSYEIDKETFLIKTHRESWDIAPFEGVKQIFRKPTLKI
jgi:hypothetical protein